MTTSADTARVAPGGGGGGLHGLAKILLAGTDESVNLTLEIAHFSMTGKVDRKVKISDTTFEH